MSLLSVQWFGVNAVRFTHNGFVVLLDPYLTRNPDAGSDPAYLKRHLPEADVIVVSHSHWDHLADVPAIAGYTGATVVGSQTTTSICRAFGVPEAQLVTVGPGGVYREGEFKVRLLPSLHALSDDGQVAYPGSYALPPPLPVRREDYLEGGTFAPLLSFGAVSVLDIGSANCIDEAIAGQHCDLLMVSIARMERTPGFLQRVLGSVTTPRIMAVHFDDFTRSLENGLWPQPYVDMDEFRRQAQRLAPYARVILPDLCETLTIGGEPLRQPSTRTCAT